MTRQIHQNCSVKRPQPHRVTLAVGYDNAKTKCIQEHKVTTSSTIYAPILQYDIISKEPPC